MIATTVDVQPTAASREPLPGPRAPEPGGPGFWGAAGLCAIWTFLAGVVAIELFLLAALHWLQLPPLAVLLAAQVLASAGTLWYGLGRVGLPVGAALRVRRFPPRLVPGLVLASVGAAVLCVPVIVRLPVSGSFLRTVTAMVAQSGWVVRFALGVVAAPVLEELLFRGLILGALRRRYGIAAAVCGSTALFALIHGNPPQMLAATVVGLGASWLVVRTGSVIPGMLVHASWNVTVMFLLPAAMRAGGYVHQGATPPDLPAMLLTGAALLALAAGGVLWWQLMGTAREPLELAPEPVPGPRPRPASWRLAALLGLPLLLVVATGAMAAGRRLPLPGARTAPVAPDPATLAGCYEITPRSGSLALFGDAPGAGQVRLTLDKQLKAGDRARYRVENVAPTGSGIAQAPVYWFPTAPGALRIVRVGPELGGAVVRLETKGGALGGTLTRFDRVGAGVGGAEPVRGRRIPCTPAVASPWPRTLPARGAAGPPRGGGR